MEKFQDLKHSNHTEPVIFVATGFFAQNTQTPTLYISPKSRFGRAKGARGQF